MTPSPGSGDKSIDWGTTLSLLAVLLAVLIVGWRLSAILPPSPEIHEPKALPAQSHEQNLHAKAVSPSPIERMFEDADGGSAAAPASDAAWSYHLDRADHTTALAPELDEVSDIAAAAEPGTLWAVNDEGNTKMVYRFSATTGKLAQQIEFGPSGDYEGVTCVRGRVIAARNDGELFITDLNDGGTTTADSHLGPTCNLEGITWQTDRSRLLLSCKSELPKLAKEKKSFGIYAMDLDSHAVVPQPVIILTRQAIDDYVGTHGGKDPRLNDTFGDEFAPKAIGIDPKSGQIVMLSARGPMIVVLEPNGTLLRVEALDPLQHPQPEGLAFDANGTLYISDKSRGARAHLSAYQPTKEAVR